MLTPKILLIEDEQILRELLERKLIQAGYEVTAVNNGLEGLAAIRQEKPTLILLDIIMPQMDGFTFLEEIRLKDEFRPLPVIVLSNSGQPVELNKLRDLGVRDWIIKTNFDPDEVILKVKKILTDQQSLK